MIKTKKKIYVSNTEIERALQPSPSQDLSSEKCNNNALRLHSLIGLSPALGLQ